MTSILALFPRPHMSSSHLLSLAPPPPLCPRLSHYPLLNSPLAPLLLLPQTPPTAQP